MNTARRRCSIPLALAVLGLGALVFPAAPAQASGTYVELHVRASRFQARAGFSGLAVVLVSVEDFENPAFQGAAIEDVTIQGNPNPPPVNDPNGSNAFDFDSWRFKNPVGGVPPGSPFLIATGLVANLGDGVYGFTIQPSVDGIWRAGEYLFQVRLIKGRSVIHTADTNTLCGIATSKLVIP